MKSIDRFRISLLLLIAVLALPVTASAYSFLAWGGMTGAKTFSLTPYYSVDFTTGLGSPSFSFGYGFTDRIDITLDVTYQYILPRFDLFANNLAIVAISLGSTPGLQLHGVWDTLEHFALVYNVIHTSTGWDFAGSDVSFLLSPVLKLGNWGIWLEGQANTVVAGPAYQLAAGAYAFLGDNMISVGVIDITGAATGIGAWLWIPIFVK